MCRRCVLSRRRRSDPAVPCSTPAALCSTPVAITAFPIPQRDAGHRRRPTHILVSLWQRSFPAATQLRTSPLICGARARRSGRRSEDRTLYVQVCPTSSPCTGCSIVNGLTRYK